MPLFTPTIVFERITCITPEFLGARGLRALILDVDNTLTAHGSQELPPDVAAWLDTMRAAGVKLTIASNNMPGRVAPFAKRVGLEYQAFCCKPSPFGLRRARRAMGVSRREVALVGDQIFTDILGANLCGMRSVLLDPLSPDPSATVRFKRSLEGFLRPHYTRLTAGEETVKSKA